MSRTLTTALLLGSASLAMAAPKATAAKPSPAAAAAIAAPSPAASPKAPEVVVKTTEPIHALVLPMKGSYAQHPDAFMQLGGQLASQGKEPVAPPFARYMNTIAEVSEAELLWEVCFPVDASTKATAPAVLKDIPGGLAATLVFKGSVDKLQEAWTSLTTWVGANGYRASGPIAMFFIGEPDPSEMQVELRVSIEKT